MEGHNDGCPILIGTLEAMAEWKKGRDYGFGDNFIAWYQVKHYPSPFQCGYRVGKTEIDELVDRVAQEQYA